jgi:hypothetical protein
MRVFSHSCARRTTTSRPPRQIIAPPFTGSAFTFHSPCLRPSQSGLVKKTMGCTSTAHRPNTFLNAAGMWQYSARTWCTKKCWRTRGTSGCPFCATPVIPHRTLPRRKPYVPTLLRLRSLAGSLRRLPRASATHTVLLSGTFSWGRDLVFKQSEIMFTSPTCMLSYTTFHKFRHPFEREFGTEEF